MKEDTRKNTLCLDGLKGLAAFIIAFCWHYNHLNPGNNGTFAKYLPLSFKYGHLMVEIFFMLSGFGMMVGYGSKILNKKINFKEYIIKRIKKIYPIFLVTLILTTIFEYIYLRWFGETFIYSNFDLHHFVLNLFCVQNGIFDGSWSFNSPSWCISICLIMYCIFYFVVYKSKNKNEVLYKFIAILCLTKLLVDAELINNQLSRGFICFSIGVILSFVYENKDKFNYKLIGVLLFSFLVFTYYMMRTYDLKYTGEITQFIKYGIAPFTILCILLFKPLNKLFSIKPLTTLGNISLEIYLFHFPIQCLIKLLDHYFNLCLDYTTKPVWIIYVLLTILIAFIYNRLLKDKVTKFLINIFRSNENTKRLS